MKNRVPEPPMTASRASRREEPASMHDVAEEACSLVGVALLGVVLAGAARWLLADMHPDAWLYGISFVVGPVGGMCALVAFGDLRAIRHGTCRSNGIVGVRAFIALVIAAAAIAVAVLFVSTVRGSVV